MNWFRICFVIVLLMLSLVVMTGRPAMAEHEGKVQVLLLGFRCDAVEA